MSQFCLQFLPLAQSSGNTGGIVAVIIGMIVGLVIGLAIGVAILWLIYDALNAVPEQYRAMPPLHVFLCLIPLFGLVWTFFVVNRVPRSFDNYFTAIGRPQPGDYGKNVGMIWAVATCCSIIPFIGVLAGLAALVCMILFIVKIRALKTLIVQSSSVGGFPVMPANSGVPPLPQQP